MNKLTGLIFSLLLAGCSSGPYVDGIYKGTSRAIYTSEEFYGNVEISVVKGWISKIDFKIIDKKNNELFDDKYEKHFKDSKVYTEQCRNDWKGVQNYPVKLLKYQTLDKVDAVTGATWSYNMFRYSTVEALKNARKK